MLNYLLFQEDGRGLMRFNMSSYLMCCVLCELV